MNKKLSLYVMVMFMGLTLAVSGAYATEMTGMASPVTSSLNLIGASVQDSHGEFVGIVNQVLIDSGGHAFAVINHGDYDLYGTGGVNTPVPFEVLRWTKGASGADKVVFTMDMEHLDFAPYLNPANPLTRQSEGNIYRYYGVEPYWTETVNCPK